MGDTLKALHRLQEVELQLAEIRGRREARVRKIQVHKRHIDQATEKLERIRRARQERQSRLDAIQLDAAAREVSLAKHREALNAAKTNKEYSAILAAMNTEKADNAKLESRILELMEEVQALEEETGKITAEREALIETAKDAEKVLEDFDAGSKEQTDRLMAKRQDFSANIAPTTLVSFTRVAEHHDGEAMASILKVHPKRDEYVCQGCNMKVTLEIVNTLKTRDEIQLCPICGRILYLERSGTS